MSRGRFTRMGVINLYEYANEVFVFEDGKLVIKGANGVGKSRALELTYPLLLEGNIAEYRADTTGKQGRPFAWNLSLGDVYTRRTGYAWFGEEPKAVLERYERWSRTHPRPGTSGQERQ